MSASVPSRENVLERIRAATQKTDPGLRAEAYASLPREYVRRGTLSAEARVELMVERLRGYDAEVTECRPETLAGMIAVQLEASGRRRFVAPKGLPAEWMAAGFEWTVDHGLTAAEVETAEGVVTASFGGVADSGTIVLHHSAAEGRRVLTLLPDWHLCVLKASDVVETLPEYFARCASRDQVSGVRGQDADELPRLVTWISGPSATADIEMTRIKGVHGPRFLHVVLVRDE
jgi:L-lactate dehydrogenase complex protein LldG